MSTLSTLKSSLSRYLGAQYIYNGDQQTAALNYARKYILLNYYVDEFCVETTLTFTSGKATIPSDYLRRVKLYTTSDATDEYDRVNVNDFDSDISKTWTIKDDSGTRKIWVSPDSTTSLTLRYIKLPSDMSSDSDTSYFNTWWDDAHCLIAAWWLLFNDRQPEAANKLTMANELLQTVLRQQSEDEEELQTVSTYFDDHLLLNEDV